MRPSGDFISEADLEATEICPKCNDVLIKMFAKDHVCEPEKLRAAAAHQEGDSGSQPQQVEQSAASEQNDNDYNCDKCGQKYSNINEYSYHLDFHDKHPQILQRIQQFQRDKAQKEINEGGPASDMRAANGIEEEKKDDNGSSAAKQAQLAE